jgi:hypothetical protein
VAAPQYEERYCAFVDILGFRALIQRLRDGRIDPQKLKNLLSKMHNPPHSKRQEFASSDFRALSISDAVALSTNTTGVGLGHLLFVLEELTTDLLFEGGFLLRGAIVKGNLYHDSQVVFGEALVEAYRLESEVVRYPRIMVTRNVVRDATRYWGNASDQRIKHSDDGPAYVHVLRGLERDIEIERKDAPDIDAEDSPQLNYYVEIGDRIQKNFRLAVDDPRHFEKVQWFARYWNRVISEHPFRGLRLINGAGLN